MLQKKYFRIQDRYLSKIGKPGGIFSMAHFLSRQKIFNDDEIELFKNIDIWFTNELPEPDFYKDKDNKCITWFKTGKCDHLIEKLTPIMKLFDKYNKAYDIVYTDYPGEIVYEDEYQIGSK